MKTTTKKESRAELAEKYANLKNLVVAIKNAADKADDMPSAPLDGTPEHQKTNGEKLLAKMAAFSEIARLLKENDVR